MAQAQDSNILVSTYDTLLTDSTSDFQNVLARNHHFQNLARTTALLAAYRNAVGIFVQQHSRKLFRLVAGYNHFVGFSAGGTDLYCALVVEASNAGRYVDTCLNGSFSHGRSPWSMTLIESVQTYVPARLLAQCCTQVHVQARARARQQSYPLHVRLQAR